MSGQLPTPAMSDVDLYRQMTGSETAVYSPLTPNTGSSMDGTPARRPSEDTREYEREEREMFAKLEKPRVRYDVEVITKLIVYTGKDLYFVSGDKRQELTLRQVLLGSPSKVIQSCSS